MGVLRVDEGGVGERFLESERGARGELAGGEIVFITARRRYADTVIGARRTLGPRQGEIKMMAGAPRDGLVTVVGQGEFAGEAERGEAVADVELELVRINRAGLGGGGELRGETSGVEARDLEIRMAGKAVHRHGPTHPIGRTPKMDVAAVKRAGVEGKQDWVTPACFEKIIERVELGPVDDVAHGAIAEREVPIHQAGAFFGISQKRGRTDAPARQRVAEVGKLFHAAQEARRGPR